MKSWKLSWKEEVYDGKKNCSLKIKVSEVLLCFKDKESDKKFLVFRKDIASDESTIYVKKLPIIWFKLKWLFCNENTYILILNNQYYIWWLCKKLNPKGFDNIILIRKRRIIIFLWRTYKLLLWIV